MGQPNLDYSPELGQEYDRPTRFDHPKFQSVYALKEGLDMMGPRSRRIVTQIVPEFVDKFITASSHYGDDNADVLGVQGQFADIWRKIGPLKRALWESQTLTREQPREILMDLIGHCLLTIEMLDRQAEEAASPPATLTL